MTLSIEEKAELRVICLTEIEALRQYIESLGLDDSEETRRLVTAAVIRIAQHQAQYLKLLP